MNKYENVMVNMMIKMHFSLPIKNQGNGTTKPKIGWLNNSAQGSPASLQLQ